MPFLGTDTRLRRVGEAIRKMNCDIVALQEIFFYPYYRLFSKILNDLPYHCFHLRFGYFLAGGLVIFSRFPLEMVGFILFRKQGSLTNLNFLDRLSRKGCLVTRSQNPSLFFVNTHLVSNESADYYTENAYTTAQSIQAQQLGVILNALDPKVPLVTAGDFNLPPQSALYKELLACAHMENPLNKNLLPTWNIQKNDSQEGGEHIDYILVRGLKPQWSTVKESYIFRDQAKGSIKKYLSDHCGITLELS